MVSLVYAQMAESFPLAGSVFSYLSRGLHSILGFFAGWAILLDYLLTRRCSASSRPSRWSGSSRRARWLWALVFVTIHTVVNVLGISSLKLANRVFLAIELVFAVVFVIIAGTAINGGTIPGAE